MKFRLLAVAMVFVSSLAARAWDYEGHRIVNQIALASLPKNFPAFALTPEARERVAVHASDPPRLRGRRPARAPRA